MKSVSRVVVKPFMDSKEVDEETGLHLVPEEGSEYNQLPEMGELVQCPSGNIPVGSTVYFHYWAWSENQTSEPYANSYEEDGVTYLFFPEEYIKMYELDGERTPVNCIFIEHKEEEHTFGEYTNKEKLSNVGVVTYSEEKDYPVGSEVEFFKNADFEIHIGKEKLYYIQYPNLIRRINGECVNGWNKVKEYKEWQEVNGLILKTPPLPISNIFISRINYDKMKLYKEYTSLPETEVLRRYRGDIMYSQRKKMNLWYNIEEGEYSGELVLLNQKAKVQEGYVRTEDIDLVLTNP